MARDTFLRRSRAALSAGLACAVVTTLYAKGQPFLDVEIRRPGGPAALGRASSQAEFVSGRRARRAPRRGKTRQPQIAAVVSPHSRPRSTFAHVRAAGGSGQGSGKSSLLISQIGLFLIYFFLQGGMGFYMKWVLSKVRVAEGLAGVPASFFVTASQQLVVFSLVMCFIAASRFFGKPFQPKELTSRREKVLVFLLSVSFSLNIGLNLFSMMLIPLSLTLVVRACLPLSTAISQTLIQRKSEISPGEWASMVFGVCCAISVVLSQSGGVAGLSSSPAFVVGLSMVILSTFCGALDLVFKSVLGTDVKLSALDTIYHMALPVAAITTTLGCFLAKPVPSTWAARYGQHMTDLAVFQKLWQVNPGILAVVATSGVFAFGYNIFTTFLVVKLSPTTTSFAGNFNKAATILLALIFVDRAMPTGPKGAVLLAAIMGNIAAFTVYNALRQRRLERTKLSK